MTSYERRHITIIGVYAPKEGREEETIRFYKQLQKQIDKYSKSDSQRISGDLNARVGNQLIPNVVKKIVNYMTKIITNTLTVIN